ncbi:MAG: Holliday junction resolvase RuvX, partial [Oscillospiraceae bacterium]|nr:Holliday junction resolvase RuvX [Oscillospiraceae bacterium]
MRVMAVDYGDARTGVAVSDISATLVGDAWVIHSKSMNETSRQIAAEAKGRDVSCIVIGYPKNMDGSIGFRAEKSEKLAELLRSLCDIEIKLWDERLTTKSAHQVLSDVGKRGKKRKATVDAVAASLILEG